MDDFEQLLQVTGSQQKMFKLQLKNFVRCVDFDYRDGHIIVAEQPLKEIIIPDVECCIGFYSTVMLSSGSASIVLNDVSYEFSAGQILVLEPEDVIIFEHFSADATLKMFAMSGVDFIRVAYLNREMWRVMLQIKNHPLVSLSPESARMFIDVFNIISDSWGEKFHHYGREMSQSIFKTMHYTLLEDMSTALDAYPEDSEYTRSNDLFAEFLRKASAKGGERKPVEQMAEEMGISAKYLSKVVRDNSGATPIEWLNLFTAKAAQKRLLESQDPVKVIALDMGFPTSASFCTFIKKNLGMTPQEVRMNAGSSR